MLLKNYFDAGKIRKITISDKMVVIYPYDGEKVVYLPQGNLSASFKNAESLKDDLCPVSV